MPFLRKADKSATLHCTCTVIYCTVNVAHLSSSSRKSILRLAYRLLIRDLILNLSAQGTSNLYETAFLFCDRAPSSCIPNRRGGRWMRRQWRRCLRNHCNDLARKSGLGIRTEIAKLHRDVVKRPPNNATKSTL